jgi:tRNA1(Val) A37 N6-methylase TrmN6
MTDLNFLGGTLRLRQSPTGHRAGTDAVLLAATVQPGFAGHVVDAGSASGAVGLAVAARVPAARISLIEIDESEAALAEENAIANGFRDRTSVVKADLLADFASRKAAGLTKADADLVLTNPPYLDQSQVRASPDENRQRAHMMPEGGLERWVVACHALLKPRGILTMIHRADALPDVLGALAGRFGDVRVLPIYPREGSGANRILISGVKGSRAPLSILGGLIVHDADGRFTPHAEALHRGQSSLILRS